MLDDYEKTTVKVGIKVSKVTTAAMFKGAVWLLKKILFREKTGIVSIGHLMRDGSTLASAEMKSPDFEALARVMKRYNIGVSLIKHTGTDEYTMFFKAKNNAQLAAALKEYLRIKLKEMPNLQNTVSVRDLQAIKLLPEKTRSENVYTVNFGKGEPPQLGDTSHTSPKLPPSPSAPAVNLAYSEKKVEQTIVMIKPPPRSIRRELAEARVVSRAMQKEFEAQRAEKMKDKQRSEPVR